MGFVGIYICTTSGYNYMAERGLFVIIFLFVLLSQYNQSNTSDSFASYRIRISICHWSRGLAFLLATIAVPT
jgi:hypothetical protein